MPPWQKSELSDKQWYVVISQDCQIIFIFTFTENQYERKNSNLTYAELHSDFFLSPRFIQDLFLTRIGDSSSPILSFKKVWKSRLFMLEKNTFFRSFVDATCDDLFTFQMC